LPTLALDHPFLRVTGDLLSVCCPGGSWQWMFMLPSAVPAPLFCSCMLCLP
jgi:hypothetical protein